MCGGRARAESRRGMKDGRRQETDIESVDHDALDEFGGARSGRVGGSGGGRRW